MCDVCSSDWDPIQWWKIIVVAIVLISAIQWRIIFNPMKLKVTFKQFLNVIWMDDWDKKLLFKKL